MVDCIAAGLLNDAATQRSNAEYMFIYVMIELLLKSSVAGKMQLFLK